MVALFLYLKRRDVSEARTAEEGISNLREVKIMCRISVHA